MKLLNLPKEVDNFLYFQFVIFFLIGFLVNVFSNGQASIIYLDNTFLACNPQEYIKDHYDLNLTEFEGSNSVYNIREYKQSLEFKNNLALYGSLILYFLVSPLLNIIFFFTYKNEK